MTSTKLAFGVEPGSARYQLRFARYHALAESVVQFIRGRSNADGRPVTLLDAGQGTGRSRRYIEARGGTENIEYHGVDRFSVRPRTAVYKHESWKFYDASLEQGLPFLKSDCFDVVICEQVLEHLHHAELTLSELIRVLKPRGLLVVGVPIFPHGAHLIRKHVVPVLDRWIMTKKSRGHVQAFSLRTLMRALRKAGPVKVSAVRGFRIISGGPLRVLENFRWCWKLNCFLGSKVPWLCTEVQIVATKQAPSETVCESHPREGQYLRKAA